MKRSFTSADTNPRKKFAREKGKVRTKPKSVASNSLTNVSMPYASTQQRSLPGAGLSQVVDVVYRGNCVYDPVYALGGHQAFGFDQMSSIYKDFYVKSSTLTVEVEGSTSNSQFGSLLIWADTNPASPGDSYTARERCAAAKGKMQFLKCYAAGTTKLSATAYTKALLHTGMEEQGNHGSSSASPANQWFWHVCTTLEDTTLTRLHFVVENLLFDVVWSESTLNVGS